MRDDGIPIKDIEQYGREAVLEQFPQVSPSEIQERMMISEFRSRYPYQYLGTNWVELLANGIILHQYEEQKDGSYCLNELSSEENTYYPLFVQMKDGSTWTAGFSTNHTFAQMGNRFVSQKAMEEKRWQAKQAQKEREQERTVQKAKKRRCFLFWM